MKAAIVLLASFLLTEAVFLALPDVFFPDAFYVYDSDLGFRVRPYARYGTAQANEFGFNDRDYSREPGPGVYRILALSDSFNWAGGPGGNYTALLEEEFARRYGKGRVEVVAAGYPMTHTAEQLALLKKFGLRYNPDLVLLGFYAGNDFLDGHPRRRRVAYGGTFADYNSESDFFFEAFGRPVLFKSRLLAFLNEKYVVWSTRRRIREERRLSEGPATREGEGRSGTGKQATPPSNARKGRDEGSSAPQPLNQLTAADLRPGMAHGDYLRLVRDQSRFADLRHESDFGLSVDNILGALGEMSDLLEKRGIPLVVAAYPARWQVDQALRAEMLERYGLPGESFEWMRAQRILAAFCRRRGIEFHDLAPPFRAQLKRGRILYIADDAHWNSQGNRLAARELIPILAPYIETP